MLNHRGIILTRSIRTVGLVAILSLVLMPFQNCGGGGGGGGGSSSSTSSAAGSCPVSSNSAPSGSVSASTVNLQIGMGTREGHGADQNLTVNFNSGDSRSRIDDVRCRPADQSGVNVTCNLNAAVASGSLTARIAPANGAECLTGPITVEVQVTDSIYNGNAPDNRCASLRRTNVRVATFTVNRTNGCLATQRLNPATPYDNSQFGNAVAIEGTTAVVSAPGDEAAGVDAGAAFVLTRGNAATNPWSITQKLTPSTAGAGTLVSSVALSGNYIALGSTSANAGSGAVWIFQFNGTSWAETGVIDGPSLGSNFGRSLAISGTNLAVGAPGENLNANGALSGAVHVFSITSRTQTAVLTPVNEVAMAPDPILRGEFGTSLAYSGTRLAVGAPFPNSTIARREAVYIYNNNVLALKIRNTADTVSRFGYALDLEGDNLVIGAPYHMNRRGRAFLYSAANGNLSQTYEIPDPNNDDIDSFGQSVSLSGNRVAVSAPSKAEAALNYGAVYLYSTANATVLRKVRSHLADRGADQFGFGVGLSGGWILSGALNDDQNGYNNTGAAYLVNVNGL